MLLRLAYLGVTNVFALLRLLPSSSRDKDTEILALRHQLSVLQRQLGPNRVRFTKVDRALLAALLHRLPRDLLNRLHLLLRPDTVLRWHRDSMGRRHARRSRPWPGRCWPEGITWSSISTYSAIKRVSRSGVTTGHGCPPFVSGSIRHAGLAGIRNYSSRAGSAWYRAPVSGLPLPGAAGFTQRPTHYEGVLVRCSRVQSPRFFQVRRMLLAAIVCR